MSASQASRNRPPGVSIWQYCIFTLDFNMHAVVIPGSSTGGSAALFQGYTGCFEKKVTLENVNSAQDIRDMDLQSEILLENDMELYIQL